MQRRSFLAGVGSAAVGVTVGCLSGSDGYDVGMTADSFRPAEVTVAPGETVVWENTSTRSHTVTAYEGAIPDGASFFASGGYGGEAAAREAWDGEFGGELVNGDRFSRAFEVPGRYDYFCIPHEEGGMVGAVIVEG